MVYNTVEWLTPVKTWWAQLRPGTGLSFFLFGLILGAGTYIAISVMLHFEPECVMPVPKCQAYNNILVPMDFASMLFIALGPVVGIFRMIGSSVTHKGEVALHQYRCNHCGYPWKWREDQPKPVQGPITPNQDLIRKGQENLRRNAQAAAADAYQRQLRGGVVSAARASHSSLIPVTMRAQVPLRR
jgi:hypothetical protein